jgi:zinc/manganese transport system permease protein
LRSDRMEMCFLLVMALATAMSVPVVGALLIFSLMIGPPAAARSFTDEPWRAMWLSVAIALGTVWVSIAVSYTSNLPIGFFVGMFGALAYAVGRGWAAWSRRRPVSASA